MADTTIQTDLTIQGDLVAKDGGIIVSGKVIGNIQAKSVQVTEPGQVKGGIEADDVTIAGLLDGSVKCNELALEEKSELKADVIAGTMTMSSGAKIDGRVKASGG